MVRSLPFALLTPMIASSTAPLRALAAFDTLALQFSRGFEGIGSSSPDRRLHEGDHEYLLSLAFPGVRPSEFKVEVDGTVLTVTGESNTASGEYSASSQVRVPRDAELKAATAKAANGILSITLPKQPRVTHTIEVLDTIEALPESSRDDYKFTVTVPGMRASDLKLVYEDGILSIDGQTKTKHGSTKTSEKVRVPPGADVMAATAAAENGVLTIHLPQKITSMNAAPSSQDNGPHVLKVEVDNTVNADVPVR